MNPPYLYEPHLHTSETSKCGWLPARRVVELYAELGYAGIAVTDHLHQTYVESLDVGEDWRAAMDHYLAGYRAAKSAGEELGLDVILGAELRFEQQNGNDYLLYGIDEAFLYDNPFLFRMGREAFFERFGKERLIVQAHPFRNGNNAVFPEYVHGVEVVNGNPRHKNRNELALSLCEAHPGLLRLCGSDTHRPGDEGTCALALFERAADSFALREAIRERRYTLRGVLDVPFIEKSNRFIESTRA